MSAKIIIVGDLFPVPQNFSEFTAGNVNYLFGGEICKIFREADFRICNLEGAMTDGDAVGVKTGPVVKAPTSTINGVKSLGIDCCMLANNHITDAGHQGVVDTLATLKDAKIPYLGAGVNVNEIRHSQLVEINGYKVGLYNVAETMYNEPSKSSGGAWVYDEYVVCKEIESLKTECDYLIVIYHGGAEKFRYPSPQTRKRFHRMVDSGANMILSQHTHCVGCEEYYKDAYLLYGQGNFLFRSFNNEFTDTGLIIELALKDDGFFVKKYLVNAVGYTVRYDNKQDFAEFERRSREVYDEEQVLEKFREYCLKEVPLYIKAYKGGRLVTRLISRLFPKTTSRYMLKNYTKNQLLFSLHSLRSEQNREVAIGGIKELLRTGNYR